MSTKSYNELMTLNSFTDRYNYLKLDGQVGVDTFGFDRYLNQVLYKSAEWKKVRQEVLLRDNGRDLGSDDHEICGKVLVHHINPITVDDIKNRNPMIFDPNNLISVSLDTHNAIHYGDESLIKKDPIERRKNDTCPWR